MKICIWSLGEFLVRVRPPCEPHSPEICLPATNSPTTEAASFCQLQGGFVPPGLWSSSSCCSQGCPAVQPGSSTGRDLQLPSVRWSHHGSAKHLVGVGFFQTLTFKFRFITEFTYIEKNKNRSSLLSIYLRSRIVVKINQMGALKQISLICYQAEKKLGKKTPLK